jgi:hypothetical protein
VNTDIVRNLVSICIVKDVQYFLLLIREATAEEPPFVVFFGEVICVISWSKVFSSFTTVHVVVVIIIIISIAH